MDSSVEASEPEQRTVIVQVHRPATPPSLRSSTPAAASKRTLTQPEERRKRKRVAILSDSQGKNFHQYMKDLEEDFDVFVYSVPGGKMKHVLSQGVELVKDFTEDDFVIVLAGSNDVNINEPAQMTIRQGLNKLFSLKTKTNILLNQIPYRYDIPRQNNNIFFYNQSMLEIAHNYRGTLEIVCQDINSILGRAHFSKHGLHYSHLGKRHLGQHFSNFVRGYHSCRLTTVKSSTTRLQANNHCLLQRPRCREDDLLDAIEHLPLSQSLNPTQSPLMTHSTKTIQTPILSTLSMFPSTSPPPTIADVFNNCNSPGGPGSSQFSPNITTHSEPWGRSISESTTSSDNFLDLHSWPNLVK